MTIKIVLGDIESPTQYKGRYPLHGNTTQEEESVPSWEEVRPGCKETGPRSRFDVPVDRRVGRVDTKISMSCYI